VSIGGKAVGFKAPTVGEAYSLGGAFVTAAWREQEQRRLAARWAR
jgi:hypothetical protein